MTTNWQLSDNLKTFSFCSLDTQMLLKLGRGIMHGKVGHNKRAWGEEKETKIMAMREKSRITISKKTKYLLQGR